MVGVLRGAFSARGGTALRGAFTARPSQQHKRASAGRCSASNEVRSQCERSPLVEKEIYVLTLLLGCEMDENYLMDSRGDVEAAQTSRYQANQLDSVLEAMQHAKGDGSAMKPPMSTASPKLAQGIIALRTKLDEAVAQEDYEEASRLRDELAHEELSSKVSSRRRADREEAVRDLRYCLGECVQHRHHDYRGVVVGFDLSCCESEEWQAEAGVADLSRGVDQPFYHVLVHSGDWGRQQFSPLVPQAAYVAEELMSAPRDDGLTWSEVHGDFQPYCGKAGEMLFLGRDNHGNMLPIADLRDRYGVERKDVYRKGEEPGGAGEGPPEESSTAIDDDVKGKLPGIDLSSLYGDGGEDDADLDGDIKSP